jgi:hypothetical protein|tara:strand:- start:377 stop:661 length:285 start_codon:yes stop_codon:yes gene_type:complete
MAVGDIISDIVASGGWRYFTPAATVEIIITCIVVSGESYFGHYNGADGPSYAGTGYAAANTMNQYNLKMGLTNTNYLGLNSAASDGSYSGLQIK